MDVVENNPTHSYMIKGKLVYQQCGRATILYWGTFKQLNQRPSHNFTLKEKHMCLHMRLASLFFKHSPTTIYIFSLTPCVGKYKSFEEEIAIYHDNFVPVLFVTLVINWQKYKKKNSRDDLQMLWTYLHYPHYLANRRGHEKSCCCFGFCPFFWRVGPAQIFDTFP